MLEENETERIVYRAIDAANELSLGSGLSKDTRNVLLGEGGQLNSMDFVNLVVALEEEVEAATGRALSIADRLSSDTSTRQSWTVGQLIELVAELLAAAPARPAGGGAGSGA